MTINTITIILVVALAIVVFGAGIYFYIRDKTLDEIRADVYQLFLEAEHNPDFSETPKQRMVWVLQRARSLLPAWTQLFITDAFLEKVVEGWFRAVKDLLDDGKLNSSTNAVEE